MIVSITREGYVKRTSLRSYSASNEERPGMKETDDLLFAQQLNTTDTLLIFTQNGRYIYMPVHQLPDIRWKDNAQHIGNIVQVEPDDMLIQAIPVSEFKEDKFLVFFTNQGMVKRTALSAYQAQRYTRSLVAVKLKDNDEVRNIQLTNGETDIFIGTQNGFGLRFPESEVSPVGQRAAGVKGINLKKNDTVVNGFCVPANNDSSWLIAMTQRGAMKKMSLKEFESGSRANRGVVMLRELKTKPHFIVGLELINQDVDVQIRTEEDQVSTQSTSSLRSVDRYNNGSFVVDVEESGNIREIWIKTDHLNITTEADKT